MNLLKRIPDSPLANWLMMLVMATAIMMLLSYDSYLHLLRPRVDSAWFFMCGKAWMNGMVPYVDFADSKGPLLWLIYGVGYLLSHYDYHGVFWVSVVVYSFTFYFLFKTAHIFLESRSQAIMAVLITSVAIFNPITHEETRAEDFGMFFTALSLWQLCRMLYAEHTERDERTAFFAFGISLAGTLLIKYNITAMCGIFPAIGLCYLLREHHPVWRPLLACAAGFAALTLPFLIYFLIQGNFSAFIQEYFINTLQTIENAVTLQYGDMKLFFMVWLAQLIGVICMSSSLKQYRMEPVLIWIWFFSLIFIVAKHSYYYCAIGCFWIFPFVYLLNKLNKHMFGLLICSIIVLSLWTYKMLWHTSGTIMTKDYANAIDKSELLFHNKPKPTVIIKGMEKGYGVTAGILPGCKYWTLQNGYTEEMDNNNTNAILNSECDYVILGNKSGFRGKRSRTIWRKWLNEHGYISLFLEEDSTEIWFKQQ